MAPCKQQVGVTVEKVEVGVPVEKVEVGVTVEKVEVGVPVEGMTAATARPRSPGIMHPFREQQTERGCSHRHIVACESDRYRT